MQVPTSPRGGFVVIAGGLLLLAGFGWIAHLSELFVYGSPMAERPIITLVAILIGLGVVYVGTVWRALALRAKRWHLAWILAAGVGMRVVLFGTTPILEDDFYRYLWDGGVAANGVNPYSIIPQEAQSRSSSISPHLAVLAAQAGVVLERINHPAVGTIYPPVAQAAFVGAYAIEPWSLDAWRGLLLTVDLAVFLLLLITLRAADRPLHWVLIYWWNPIAIKETINSGHMDVLVVPFVLVAVIAALRKRSTAAAIALAFAVCTKIWPVILVPTIARSIKASSRQLAAAATIGAAATLAIGSPMYAAIDRLDESGIATYAGRWEMNDALFMIILGVAKTVSANPELVARFLAAMLVIAVAAVCSARPVRDGRDLMSRLGIVTGTLFMVAPAQFPWYYLWLLPMLVVAPRVSLLSLTVTLPMYFLKFHFDARGQVDLFHTRVVWLEYAPCIALAVWESIAAHRAKFQPHA